MNDDDAVENDQRGCSKTRPADSPDRFGVKRLINRCIVHASENEQRHLPVIVSPDIDGALSVWLIQVYLQDTPVCVVGIYTTSDLLMLGAADEADARRALYVDHDMFGGLCSIGNHLSRLSCDPNDKIASRDERSVNLNDYFGQGFAASFQGARGVSRDKYPFGTSHLLAHALFGQYLDSVAEREPHHEIFTLLAHADSLWSNAHVYTTNVQHWHRDAFDSAQWLNLLVWPNSYSGDQIRFDQHQKLVCTLKDELGSWLKPGDSSNMADADFRQHLVGESPMSAYLDTNGALSKRLRLKNMRSTSVHVWQALRGNQGLTDRLDTIVANKVEYLSKFRGLMAIVQRSIESDNSFAVAAKVAIPDCIGTVFSGECDGVDPRTFETDDSFGQFVSERNIDSLAITSRTQIRYTSNLFAKRSH